MSSGGRMLGSCAPMPRMITWKIVWIDLRTGSLNRRALSTAFTFLRREQMQFLLKKQ